MSNLGKKATDDDDVEQLLREAHDDVLLKLSVNSHTARGSAAAAIDADLDRRFQALKKPQKLTKKHDNSVKKNPKEADAAGDRKSAGAVAAADDDLYTRFAALKKSLPSNSSNFTRNEEADEEEDEEDEVEKVIRWATDAARLDPSPPSEDEDDDEDDNSDDDEDDGVSRGKRSKSKRK